MQTQKQKTKRMHTRPTGVIGGRRSHPERHRSAIFLVESTIHALKVFESIEGCLLVLLTSAYSHALVKALKSHNIVCDTADKMVFWPATT